MDTWAGDGDEGIRWGAVLDFFNRLFGRRRKDTRRLVCAWCKTIMREGSEPTNHGMCPKCREYVEARIEDLTRV